MANPSTTTPPSGLAGLIAQDRRRAGFFLLFLAAAIAASSAYFWNEYRKSGPALESKEPEKKQEKKDENSLLDKKDDKEVSLQRDEGKFYLGAWTALMALTLTGSGLVVLLTTPNPGKEVVSALKIVVVTGGMVGGLTALYGLSILLREQSQIIDWLEKGEHDKARGPVIGLVTVFAGLTLLFFSALPGRSEERNDPNLRALVYGSNTMFVGSLMLIILTLTNVFVGVAMPGEIDTTEAKFYSLSEESKELLKSIQEPVHAYFICTTDLGNLYTDVKSMLNNAAAINPNFKPQFLVPGVNDTEIRSLRTRLKVTRENAREGLLVTVGETEDRQAFLSLQPDLFDVAEGRAVNFNGEEKLMNELNFLSQSSGKPVLYFTQGNGEIEVGDGRGRDPNRTATRLIRYLTDRKFEIKPLRYEPAQPFTIPSDATAIVMFSPTRKIPQPFEKALHEYCLPETPDKKPGKLMLILPPIKDVGSEKIGETGLELLLIDAGIVPSNTRVYSLFEDLTPDNVAGIPNFRLLEIEHPLAKAFRMPQYLIENTRFFDVQQGRKPQYQPMPLVNLDGDQPTWLDPNFQIDSAGILQKLIRGNDRQAIEEFSRAKLLKRRDNPLAIAVAENAGPPNPMSPGPPPQGKPLFAVFGFDSLFTDQGLREFRSENAIEANLTLFTGVVDWLRERPAAIGIKPRVHASFSLDPRTVSQGRLVLTPTLWFALGVIGLGLVVWVVRRK